MVPPIAYTGCKEYEIVTTPIRKTERISIVLINHVLISNNYFKFMEFMNIPFINKLLLCITYTKFN